MARHGNAPGSKARAITLVGPATFWLIAFFLLPLVFVAVASFMSRGSGGAPVPPLTLDQYERTFTVFGPVIWRSILVAFYTTALSLLLGYPLAFFISRRRDPRVRLLLLFLVAGCSEAEPDEGDETLEQKTRVTVEIAKAEAVENLERSLGRLRALNDTTVSAEPGAKGRAGLLMSPKTPGQGAGIVQLSGTKSS